jgi:hypothetical protein
MAMALAMVAEDQVPARAAVDNAEVYMLQQVGRREGGREGRREGRREGGRDESSETCAHVSLAHASVHN